MPTTATRLITLIQLLQRHPGQKAGSLASQLGISIRTMHRYFGMLEEMGIPVFSERGRHGGFSLVRGFRMPPLVFTPEEAAAVSLGTGLVGEMWGSLYQEAARSALAKLDNLLPDGQRQEVAWARRSLVASGLQRADPSTLSAVLGSLRQALHELHRVEMLYQSPNAQAARKRAFDPYALAYRSGWWYVVGYCHLRQAVRTFRIDRIRSISVTGDTFQIPGDFEAEAFLAQEFRGQSMLETRMRFIPQAAQIALANRAVWSSLQEEESGSVLVSFSAPDKNWAASTVLAYGPLVMVLEPEEVRDTVQEWAQAVLSQYS